MKHFEIGTHININNRHMLEIILDDVVLAYTHKLDEALEVIRLEAEERGITDYQVLHNYND